MYNKITVVPYDYQWPELYKRLAGQIKEALGANCVDIHHIGSTAVPGLAAKPVIDILPVVKDIVAIDSCNKAMQSLGFEVKGECGMLFRRYFHKVENGERKANIHAYQEGHPEIERYLLFRDYLRTHPQELEAYGALKINLAKQFPDSIEQYVIGKDAFVASIDCKTKFSGLRMVEALTPDEWKEYHRIRKELFFDVIGRTYNSKHPCFSDPNHKHIVLRENTHIVGGIHLEFFEDNNVAIRYFYIDTPNQSRKLGTQFYNLIESWLIQKNVKLIQLHANDEAVNFYKRLGFEAMPFVELGRNQSNIPQVDMGKHLSNSITK